ncbi:receptor [Shigella sonnei]|nr:receptor [Shigella sonnei]
MELKKLMEHISIIPDYRQAWKVEHKLSDILLLTICAVISGAEGWEDIEDFGETHLDFLKQYGDFENGIPVHDTIARVVSCISPAKFHECFINWMRDCHSSDDKDVIAIDGKTLRHSYDKSRRRGAIHVISAFSTMHSLVLGQIKTDEKSNEITAIPELLNMLDIKGKIITTDAMGCQKDIAEKIQKQGGDYLFAVKGNQGRLNKAFEEKFPLKELNNPEHDSYAISEKSHGREEIRLHIVCDVPDELIDFTFEWKGLKKLCVAVSFRSIIAEQKKEPEMTVRYYISSADLTAEKFATAIRNHWHVENKLHWRLDVVMNEDDCKIRRGNAAELFSGIRHIAINILTNDKVFKAGLRRKMRKAAWTETIWRQSLRGAGFRNLSLGSQPNVGKDLTDEEKNCLAGGSTGSPGGWGPEDENSARDRMQHERYKDELRQKMGKPDVTDSNLKNIIDDLYRPNAKVGSGSTADAVRYELATGEKVGGRGHVLKAQDYTRALQDWLDKNPTASPGDRAAAENVLQDLQNALGGK